MTEHGRFADAVGASFVHAAGPILTLHEVSDLVEQHGTRSFSLVFHASADVVLEQGIHSLRHADLGDLDIFLVPIGESDTAREYEAVFSVIAEAAP